MRDRSSRRSGVRRSTQPRPRSTPSTCVRSGRRRISRASRGTGPGCTTNVPSRRPISWSSGGRCLSRSRHGTWSSTPSSARPNGRCPTRWPSWRPSVRSAGRGARISLPSGEQKRSAMPSTRLRCRRLADVERRATEAAAQVDAAGEQRAMLEAVLTAAQHALAEAAEAERRASVAHEGARAAADEADGTSRAAAERSRHAASALAELRGRLDALLARQADEEARGIAKAARRVGGRRLDEDLVVDPGLRGAVEAALGEAARGYLVDAAAVPGLAAERGVVVTRSNGRGRCTPPGGRPRRRDDPRTGC